METALHRQLKLVYARDPQLTEVQHGDFRIDAVGADDEWIEIQHASLGALKGKIRTLVDAKRGKPLRIVKPIVARKWIVTRCTKSNAVLRRRLSPKKGQLSDIFLDLVHIAGLFPHPKLAIEVLLVDIEEERLPKAVHRFRRKNYTTLEQSLVAVHAKCVLTKATDLLALLPKLSFESEFDTAQLAQQIERPRWFAQKVAYCMRHCNVLESVGKRGNSQLYALAKPLKTKRNKRKHPELKPPERKPEKREPRAA